MVKVMKAPSELSVAGYFRVSQARDGMKAPELYRDEIDRYCAYKRLELAEVFSDIDRSGFRGAKARPALEELTRRRLEFSAIIVPKLAPLRQIGQRSRGAVRALRS